MFNDDNSKLWAEFLIRNNLTPEDYVAYMKVATRLELEKHGMIKDGEYLKVPQLPQEWQCPICKRIMTEDEIQQEIEQIKNRRYGIMI